MCHLKEMINLTVPLEQRRSKFCKYMRFVHRHRKRNALALHMHTKHRHEVYLCATIILSSYTAKTQVFLIQCAAVFLTSRLRISFAHDVIENALADK